MTAQSKTKKMTPRCLLILLSLEALLPSCSWPSRYKLPEGSTCREVTIPQAWQVSSKYQNVQGVDLVSADPDDLFIFRRLKRRPYGCRPEIHFGTWHGGNNLQ